jgi:16S rRNA (uracil1498-N3)-methyltransferase
MSRMFFARSIEGDKALFDDHEYRHLQVMRINEGESISFTDGNGVVYTGIIHYKKTKTVAAITAMKLFEPQKTGNRISVGIAHSQWDREEVLIEKGTELGVSEFLFFPSKFSKYREFNLTKAAFSLRKAIKQSQNPFLPGYSKYDNIESFSEAARDYSVKITLHPDSQRNLFDEPKPLGKVIIVIGPEGGFHEEEVALLSRNGFVAYSVSRRILRLETAAICSFVWALLIP